MGKIVRGIPNIAAHGRARLALMQAGRQAAPIASRHAADQTDRAAQRSAERRPHRPTTPPTPTAPHPPTKTDYPYSSYTYYST